MTTLLSGINGAVFAVADVARFSVNKDSDRAVTRGAVRPHHQKDS